MSAEREAREAVARRMANYDSPLSSEFVAHNALLDAYAATIAARVDAEWRARVEGHRRKATVTLSVAGEIWDDAWNAALDALLTAVARDREGQ